MELGRFLVREYLGDRSNDTLSRWLLHAIAERISRADQAKKHADRSQFEDEATELILRLWAHRSVAPKGLDPLARYDRVLTAFRSLLPGANPWESREAQRSDRFAAELYQSMTMLTLSLLLAGLEPSRGRSVEERSLHNRFLPANEAALLLQFEQIEGLFSVPGPSETPNAVVSQGAVRSMKVAGAVRSWAQRTVELSQEILEMFKSPLPNSETLEATRGARREGKATSKKSVGRQSRLRDDRTAVNALAKKVARQKVSKKIGRTRDPGQTKRSSS